MDSSQDMVLELAFTHMIVRDSTGRVSIQCHTCQSRSYSPGDIEHRYCGRCHVFHADDPLLAELRADS